MRRPVWRTFGLVLALLTQVLAGGMRLHAHADHSARVTHVEDAHGAHDTVVIQSGERQRADAPVLAKAEERFALTSPLAISVSPEQRGNPHVLLSEPLIAQPPPRAPPSRL